MLAALLLALVQAITMPGFDANADFYVSRSGWTVFTPTTTGANTTRRIFVSSSQGSDVNCGWAGSGLDQNGQPWTSTTCPGFAYVGSHGGAHGPKQNFGGVSGGNSLLRNGYPDWIHFLRGDTFSGGLGNWNKSGLDASNRMLATSYATPSTANAPRPKFNVGLGNFIGLYDDAQYLAFVDLHAVCGAHVNNDAYRPVDCDSGGYILVEGCLGELFDNAPVFKFCHDISMRRNVFVDTLYGGTFTQEVQNYLAEENLIDNTHTTWTGSVLPDHGFYCDSENSSGFVIRGNIVSRVASHGIQCRPGGDVAGNLVLAAPIGILLGNQEGQNTPNGVTGTVIDNVVLHGRDFPVFSYGQRGWGLYIENIAAATVRGNIIAHGSGTAPRPISIDARFRKAHNLTLRENVVYKMGAETDYGTVFIQGSPGAAGLDNLQILDNDFHDGLSTQPLVNFHDSSASHTDSVAAANIYYSAASLGNWFRVAGVNKNLADFKAGFTPADTTSQAGSSTFPQPKPDAATIPGYLAFIGHASPTLSDFYAEARKQRKGFWRPAYTAQAVNEYIRQCFGK